MKISKLSFKIISQVKKIIAFILNIILPKESSMVLKNQGIVSSLRNFRDKIILANWVGLLNYRTRDLWIQASLRDIPKGLSILDAGAGIRMYKNSCNHLKYTSQDFGDFTGALTEKDKMTTDRIYDAKTCDIISDITSIPVANNSFDAILCTEVFEHISEPALAIKEFSRIVRQGGRVIITAPFCSLTHQSPYYFANGYSKYWYEKVLIENGFEIKEISFNGNFFEYMAQEIRRIPSVSEIYLSKKVGIFTKIQIYLLLRKLHKLSLQDKESQELLCFGLQVVAIKK